MSRELRPLSELLAKTAEAAAADKAVREAVTDAQEQLGPWRRALNVPQAYVAKATATTQSNVSMIESGTRSATPETLQAMYAAIDGYTPPQEGSTDGTNLDHQEKDRKRKAKEDARRRRG